MVAGMLKQRHQEIRRGPRGKADLRTTNATSHSCQVRTYPAHNLDSKGVGLVGTVRMDLAVRHHGLGLGKPDPGIELPRQFGLE